MQIVFDGHNDALSRLWCAGGDPLARFARAEGHVNVPDCAAGGMAGGFFALYSPQQRRVFDFSGFKGVAMPLPEPMAQAPALASVMGQIGIARRLAEAGRRLVGRCAELGMVVDTSHLTVRGFWDIAEMGLPLVATHSNAYDLCATTRNLTRDQLRAVGQTGGMVGLNLATVFLSPEGWQTGRAGIEACLAQIEALVAGAGEGCVGLGSARRWPTGCAGATGWISCAAPCGGEREKPRLPGACARFLR